MSGQMPLVSGEYCKLSEMRKTLPLMGSEFKASFRSRVKQEKYQLAAKMRKNPTKTEKMLWSRLRGRQLKGFKFRRQAVVLGYIADFYCPEARRVIEVDGASHVDSTAYDERRNWVMQKAGFSVLRIAADLVENDSERVVSEIAWAVNYCAS